LVVEMRIPHVALPAGTVLLGGLASGNFHSASVIVCVPALIPALAESAGGL
jgi:hypothetical protein